MNTFDFAKVSCAAAVLSLALAVQSPAQTVTTVSNFQSFGSSSPLVQDTNGNFYGNAATEGIGSEGNAYEVSTAGAMNQLSQLAYPAGGLVLASNGSLYGSTQQGGTLQSGNIFKMNTAGTVTDFYDQFGANTTLVQIGQDLYGSTVGTIFKISLSGTETTLYDYCTVIDCQRVGPPYPSALIQNLDGNFYGVTAGGNVNDGTVFRITPSGTLTTLHTFTGPDGITPVGGLVVDSAGNLYGATALGANNGCNFGEGSGCGTVFKITAGGRFTTLHKFGGGAGGANPQGGLLLGTDGNLYGVAYSGGAFNAGMIFQITPSGTFSSVYSFCAQQYCLDGATPQQALMQATNGLFYGTTREGGNQGLGVVYSLSMGLAPFVQTAPSAGGVGQKVIILGNGLTGTTSVTFNGAVATFTVISDTEIATSVPAGTTNGVVKVTTPSGTLNSNVAFHVQK